MVLKEGSLIEQLRVSYISIQVTDNGTSHSNKYFIDITTSLSEKVSSYMSTTYITFIKQYNISLHNFAHAPSYWEQQRTSMATRFHL